MLSNKPKSPVQRWLAALDHSAFLVIRFITIAALFLLLVSISANVLERQLGLGFLTVPDEIVTLMFTWMVFLGAAALVRDWSHIDVPLVSEWLPSEALRTVHHLVVLITALVFVGFMYYSGYELLKASQTRRSPMLQLPQVYWYISIPIAAGVMAIYIVARAISRLRLLNRSHSREEEIDETGQSMGR